jgi:hypothetical protein
MVQAFSQLKRVLGERRLSVQQLQGRLEEHGLGESGQEPIPRFGS